MKWSLKIIPIFFILDAFYLAKERDYRALYDEVRKNNEDEIDFNMKPDAPIVNNFTKTIFTSVVQFRQYHQVFVAQQTVFELYQKLVVNFQVSQDHADHQQDIVKSVVRIKFIESHFVQFITVEYVVTACQLVVSIILKPGISFAVAIGNSFTDTIIKTS